MPHNEKVENIPSETFYCYKPDELKNVEDEPYGGGTDTYHYLLILVTTLINITELYNAKEIKKRLCGLMNLR
jgi:hypothetical protein